MGNFFTSQYDLYKFVKNRKCDAVVRLVKSIEAATGENLEQDVKDSCVSMTEHERYNFAFDEVDSLFNVLQEKIGVQ